jgi:small-conductance mechanosensitive channel
MGMRQAFGPPPENVRRIEMSQSKLNQAIEGQTVDARWKDLYKIGGITVIGFVILIVAGGIAFAIWPYLPGRASTEEIFQTVQGDRLGGLMALDFLLFVSNLLGGILLFLALYVTLKQVNESYALIALALGLVAAVLIVPARPMAELLSLSDLYATATTDAARSQYLAGGEALLALFNGTAFLVCTLLGGISYWFKWPTVVE